MRYLFLLALLFLSFIVKAQDSLTIETKKVEGMVLDLKKKTLLEQKLLYSEQQVQSMVRLDSMYIELRTDMYSTIKSQQESINDLININQGSSLLISGIKEELKDVRLNLYNDNIKLRSDIDKLRTKNNNKTKIIVILSTVLAAYVGITAF